jgi:hypothetical protein
MINKLLIKKTPHSSHFYYQRFNYPRFRKVENENNCHQDLPFSPVFSWRTHLSENIFKKWKKNIITGDFPVTLDFSEYQETGYLLEEYQLEDLPHVQV